MTIDGFCDHTAPIADDEIHQHYTDLLNSAGLLLYGRKTFQLMEEYYPAIVKAPTGNKATDSFAVAIDNIPKIVFSRTLKSVNWKNTSLRHEIAEEEIWELKKEAGKDIFAGSPSLIVALTKLGLIDEYQLCIHPVVVGNGQPLFNDVTNRG